MVSETEVDYIYRQDKIMLEDWNWIEQPSCLVGEASVVCPGEDYDLTLKGWMSTIVKNKYEFSLLYKNTITVRKWHNKEEHTNPEGQRIRGPHKHKWSSLYKDTEVYAVDDVATDDVRQAFYDFLDECEIEHRGQFDPQSRLKYGWV